MKEDLKRRIFEQSQSSITEDLPETLVYHSGPAKKEAVEPSQLHVESVSEGNYVPDSDDEFVIAPSLLEAIKELFL